MQCLASELCKRGVTNMKLCDASTTQASYLIADMFRLSHIVLASPTYNLSICPVMESLLLKGLPVGTTLAFCMSTVAASLPEMIMLRQVMQWKLLAVFLAMLLVLFTLVGWFFNILQASFF